MKSGFKKRIVALLTGALVLGMGIDASAAVGTRVPDDGTLVGLVNAFRQTGAECTDVGFVGPKSGLAVNADLTEIAMQRAEEIATQGMNGMSHTRPNGQSCFSLTVNGTSSFAENIAAGQTDANSVFLSWREDNLPYSGQGHRRNMLGDYTTIGIGHVQYNGVDYWVQEFGFGTGSAVTTQEQPPVDQAPQQPAAPQYSFTSGAGSTWVSGSSDPLVITCDGDFSKFTGITISGVDIDPSYYDAQSGSTVISLKPEFLKSLSAGTYVMRVNYTDGAAETNFVISTETPDQGTQNTQGTQGTQGTQDSKPATGAKSPRTGENMMETQGMPGMTVAVSLVVLLAAVSVIAGMKLRKRA